MTSQCPFFCGNPVSSRDFVDRRQPLHRAVGRVLRGESTAIVGEPRCGKTSLLLYLAAPERQAELYGNAGERLLLVYLDTHVFGNGFTQAQFWSEALASVKGHLIDPNPDGSLAKQYRVCQANGFGSFTLEVLFRRLAEQSRQLVLLLDEFDLLLHHPILNSAEFFGSLRSLASRSGSALALVIASRLPLSRLNTETQAFNLTGSPYFNIFSEITLGGLPEQDVDELLRRARDRFLPTDRLAIRQLAGNHPFLLQATAQAMWDAYDEGITDFAERRRGVGQRLLQEHRQHFIETWRNWTPQTRQAFTVVALANAGDLLPDRKFRLDALLKDLANWAPELKDLENVGLVRAAPGIPGGWFVTQLVMLWWLADELIRVLRDDTAFSNWLRSAELEGRWTHGQREQLKEGIRNFGGGVTQLIERFATGFGAGFGMGAS